MRERRGVLHTPCVVSHTPCPAVVCVALGAVAPTPQLRLAVYGITTADPILSREMCYNSCGPHLTREKAIFYATGHSPGRDHRRGGDGRLDRLPPGRTRPHRRADPRERGDRDQRHDRPLGGRRPPPVFGRGQRPAVALQHPAAQALHCGDRRPRRAEAGRLSIPDRRPRQPCSAGLARASRR